MWTTMDISERPEESRTELARDTAAYFDSLPPDALAEEFPLGAALTTISDEIDFDS